MRHLMSNLKLKNWLLALVVVQALTACSQFNTTQPIPAATEKNSPPTNTYSAELTFSLQSIRQNEDITDHLWLEGEFALAGTDWVKLISIPAENQPQALNEIQAVDTSPYPIRLTTNQLRNLIGWVSNENEISALKIESSTSPLQIAAPDLPVTGLALSPGSDELVFATLDGTITRVPFTAMAQTSAEWQAPNWLSNLSYSPDGKQIGGADLAEFTVYTYQLDGTLNSTLDWGGSVSSALYGVHFSPDWKTLAWVSGNLVQLMNLNTGQETYLLNHEDAVSYAVWSPDGELLATASAANIGGSLLPMVNIWRQVNGELAASFPQDLPIQSLSFSPDGSKISVLDTNATVRIFALPDK